MKPPRRSRRPRHSGGLAKASPGVRAPESAAGEVGAQLASVNQSLFEALSDSEEKFRQMADNIQEIFWMLDAATFEVIYVNPAFESICGRARQSLYDEPLSYREIIHPAHRERVLKSLSGLAETGRLSEEFQIARPDGMVRWVWVQGFTVRNPEGRIYRFVGTVQDITDRRIAEMALKESEDRYRDLVEHSQDLICTHDLEGRLLSVNEPPARILGYSREELVGQLLWKLLLPERRPEFQDYLAKIINEGSAQGLMVVSTKSGERRIWEYHNTLRTEGVPSPLVRGVAHDVTERKRAEWALRQSEDKFSKAFRSSPDPIVLSTLADGRLLDVNDGFLRRVGYSREEVLGRTSVELNLWRNIHDRQRMLEILRRNGEVRELELDFRMKSGEFRTFSTSVQTIELGGVPSLIVILRDITERNALESQLRQAQKMEAVGLLAGGVAHEFNNALVGILGYAELLKKQLSPGSRLQSMAQHICDGALRARDITARLLALSRQQALQPQVVDLNQFLVQIIALLRPLISEDIELVAHLDQSSCCVKVDPKQLEQVILNVALNARDAMPAGGRLQLETLATRVTPQLAAGHPGMKSGQYVALRCTDTGCGMEPQVLNRVFEPFFTTKEIGKGTGLGLSTAYGIVKQSGGCIEAVSEPRKGSCFTIYLPRVGEPRASAAVTLPDSPVNPLAKTILLVEDDEMVRQFTTELLKESGYQVLSAANGLDAFRLFSERTGSVHLLLTDLVMPHMNGPELARRLRRIAPELKVLYMTGYVDEDVFERSGVPREGPRVQKPFTPETLLSAVSDLLHDGQKHQN